MERANTSIVAAFFAVILCISASACGGGGTTAPPPAPPPPPPPPPTMDDSTRLSTAELTSSSAPGLHDMAAFLPSSQATAAFAKFSGSLSFSETAAIATFSPTLERTIHPGYEPLRFPPYVIQFVSDQGDLIPVKRGIISAWPSSGSYWDVVVGPGKVWVEPNDSNWHRASFPLTLVSRREGQARNCVVEFLYTTSSVSNAYTQCSQENSAESAFAIGDMRAQVSASYTPGAINNEASVIATFRQQRAQLMPVRPWTALPVANPAALQATFNRDVVPETEQSLGALVFNGTMYRQPPLTRRGPYPYPDDMRHGVHSVSKSAAAALSLLYFAQRYGDTIFDARITDYVSGLATHPGWQGVTFGNVLDMVTGVGGSDTGPQSFIFRGDSANAAIASIAAIPDAAPAPGTVFSYSTSHTFVLSFALQKFVEAREGAGVKYWNLIQANVLDPIGVYNYPIQKSLEAGGAEGIPTLGVGAFLTGDDLAKIAALFANSGRHNNVQILSQLRTLEATNKTAWPGFPTGSATNANYQHSFWRYSFQSAARGCSFFGSAMQGFGGNYVILLPSGITVIRLTDNEMFATAPMVSAAEQVKASC